MRYKTKQVEGARFVFEPRTILRMELLVLTALKWRLRSITPFTFVEFFACKVDSSGTFFKFLVSGATQIILSTIQGIKQLVDMYLFSTKAKYIKAFFTSI